MGSNPRRAENGPTPGPPAYDGGVEETKENPPRKNHNIDNDGIHGGTEDTEPSTPPPSREAPSGGSGVVGLASTTAKLIKKIVDHQLYLLSRISYEIFSRTY